MGDKLFEKLGKLENILGSIETTLGGLDDHIVEIRDLVNMNIELSKEIKDRLDS